MAMLKCKMNNAVTESSRQDEVVVVGGVGQHAAAGHPEEGAEVAGVHLHVEQLAVARQQAVRAAFLFARRLFVSNLIKIEIISITSFVSAPTMDLNTKSGQRSSAILSPSTSKRWTWLA